jgi:hypothetical protein
LDIRWKTTAGDTLQIVANFAKHELPTPNLIVGETLWRLLPADAQIFQASDIIVRLGRQL